MGCLWKFNRELLVIRAAGPPPLPTRGFRVVADAGVDACLGVPSGVPWWWRQVGGVGAATTVRSLPRVKDEGPGHPCVCVCVCVEAGVGTDAWASVPQQWSQRHPRRVDAESAAEAARASCSPAAVAPPFRPGRQSGCH